MDNSRFDCLMDRYLDGALAVAERTEFEAMLLASAQARGRFWQQARFHALLRRHSEENRGKQLAGTVVEHLPIPNEQGPAFLMARSHRRRRAGLIGAVVCLITAAAAVLIVPLLRSTDRSSVLKSDTAMAESTDSVASPQAVLPESVAAEELMTDVVALLAKAVDASWNTEFLTPLVGEPLAPGRLRLDSGVALIEFNCGASVLLEAPVDFEIRSRDEAYCYQGRLSAVVPPPATGFRIDTPEFRVVDRGTSFGVVVEEAGRTEVHVLEGLVELDGDRLAGTREIEEGRAVVSENQEVSLHRADATKFLTTSDFARRAALSDSERIAAWRTLTQTLREDESLLVWYTFEPDSPRERTVHNRAARATSETDGTIIGCEWTDGRWPGKRALDFKRPIDRVRLNVPGELPSFTLMSWVRIDSLPNDYNSLMCSDGWDPGDFNWQIGGRSKGGSLGFSVAQESFSPNIDGMRDIVGSNVSGFVQPVDFGRWMHLGVVVDGESNRLSHWCNGRLLTEKPFVSETTVQLGMVELGNWQPRPAALYPIRNFNGRMDEFLLFNRPLSDEEIRRHYALGQPNGSIPSGEEVR